MRICLGIVALVILIFSQSVAACDFIPIDSVGVKTVKGKKFLLFKVEQGQTWYSISRKFGLSVKEVQAANEEGKSKSPSVGQILLIPIGKVAKQGIETKTIVSDREKQIVYKVKKGETLYSIAVKNTKTMEELRHWNDLKSDYLHAGQMLIVGYNKKKKEKQVTESTSPIGLLGQVKQGSVEKRDSTSVSEKSPQKEVVKKNLTDTAKTADTLKKEGDAGWKKSAAKGNEFEEHGIASFIEDQDINPNKYYALHRTAPKGTIIKVINIMNKKQIFVKVVGALPDTGDNNDLIIKISKASASKLNVLDTRFQVILNYFGE